VFEETCKNCQTINDAEPQIEVFPVDGGLVEYIYLYDDLVVNYKQREYLSRNYKTLFSEIVNNQKPKLVILIDDFVYKELEEELIYIIGFKQIMFMSLFRYEFEDFVNF
jgi:hypothetical protein